GSRSYRIIESGFCSSTQRLWGLTECTKKGAPHPLGITEADGGRYGFDGLRAALDPFAGGVEPQALDGLRRGHAGFGDERPSEMARTHGRAVCQSRHRKSLMQPFSCPRQDRREPALWPIRGE